MIGCSETLKGAQYEPVKMVVQRPRGLHHLLCAFPSRKGFMLSRPPALNIVLSGTLREFSDIWNAHCSLGRFSVESLALV